jgi:hypothetical protein
MSGEAAGARGPKAGKAMGLLMKIDNIGRLWRLAMFQAFWA